MPAHAQVSPRTIGLPSDSAKNRPTAADQPRRNARGRQGNTELLNWLTKKATGAAQVCTVTDQIARGLDIAGETVRQRLGRLTADGLVTIENCTCKAMPYSHRKFTIVRLAQQKVTPAATNATTQPAAAKTADKDVGASRDMVLLDYLRREIGDRGHMCATTDLLATGLDVAGRTVFRRLERLKAAGAVHISQCACADLPFAHRRFALKTAAQTPTVAKAAASAKPLAVKPESTPAVAPAAAGIDLRQLVPAQADTWALFRDGRTLWREPVVAWGLWHDGTLGAAGPVGVGGPLIYVGGRLNAAATVPGFAGVRVGAYRCLGEDRTFDDATLAQELE
jgi:hypothetical protein